MAGIKLLASDPVDRGLAALAAAMKAQYGDQPAALRAIDRAIENLAAGLPYEFDGVELRVTSASRAADGCVQITDGIDCTCESNRRDWCRHRAQFRLLLARMSLTEPRHLREKIVEQCAPPLSWPADSIFDYAA